MTVGTNNPYGYGISTLENLLKYLTRSVNGHCFSSLEEQFAAKTIQELIPSTSNDEIAALKNQIVLLNSENKALKQELLRDEQRIKYCIEHQVIYNDGYLYAGLDVEQVLDQDFRQAIDNLDRQ